MRILFLILTITFLGIIPHIALSGPIDDEPLEPTNIYSTTPFPLPMHGVSNREYTWTSKGDSLTIPLRQVGRIYLIEAVVDGEKGYLVFDTGASGVVLNKTYFRDYPVIGNHSSGGVNGSIEDVEKISVEKLEIFGLQYKDIVADVINLGHIENRRGVKILGLIGFSMISDFEIIFNPNLGQLKLYKINKKGDRICSSSTKFNSDYTTKIEYSNNILFLKTVVNGKSLKFCFDTGAETNVIDRFAPKNILNSISIKRRSKLTGAGSNTSEVLFGTMNGFTFGQDTINGMETVITNLSPMSESYGTNIDGMLGYSFISKGVICINFVKKQFSINYLKETD